MPGATITPDEHVETRLQQDLVAWLTTVRPNGQPDSVPIWFLWRDGEILIYSRENKTKLANLARNPRVTVALDDTHGGGDVARFEGTASHVPDHLPLHEVPAYVDKYAKHIRGIGYSDAEAFAQDYSAAIIVTPTRLRAWH